MRSQAEKAATFRALHDGPAFVIPNPWDQGSARMLVGLGYPAIATTSAGFAFTRGRLDGEVALDAVVDHVAALVEAVDVPVSVDLENGHGPEPQAAAAAIVRVGHAGAVGGSIEDWDPSGRIYDIGHAAERVAAAVESARGLGFPFTLTARAENHIRGNPDLDDTILRLRAYEAAGADVLYAPGLETLDQVTTVCAAVSKPVNVLARPHLTMVELVAAGARRVSLGGSLTWVAVDAVVRVLTAIHDRGDFSGLRPRPPLPDWFV